MIWGAIRKLWHSLATMFQPPTLAIVTAVQSSAATYLDPMIKVDSIDAFRALPHRERARRTIDALKRMKRFTPGMSARELEDYEIIAALLLGKGEIK